MGNSDSTGRFTKSTFSTPSRGEFQEVEDPARDGGPVDSGSPAILHGHFITVRVSNVAGPRTVEVMLDVEQRLRVTEAARLSERLKER
jgi:hypothetical protein